MNDKKTGRALDVVPCDLTSTYVVISMSRRRTFVRTLVRQNSCKSKTLLSRLSSTGSSAATTRQGLGVRAYSSLAGGDSAEILRSIVQA